MSSSAKREFSHRSSTAGRVAIGILIVSAMTIAALAVAPLARTEATAQSSYLIDSALPAVVLIYSRIDFQGTFYIPWDTGTEAWTVTSYIAVMGSGFFVNPSGYIVTNGHVVFCLESDDYHQDSYTQWDLIEGGTEFLIAWGQANRGWPSWSSGTVDFIKNFNHQHATINSQTRSVYAILGEASGNIVELKRGISATVVNVDPFLGRDLAILKVELSNAPSLLIGDSDKVKVGDAVYAFGYPGVVTFHPLLSANTYLLPTVTQGVVSAKRQTTYDIPAIQHSAPITHGNSGGPLVDEQGRVIGINNMGSISDLGLEISGFNFAIASNVLRDFLRENGVENIVGDNQLQYQQGLAFYLAKMYGTAKRKFDAVAALFTYQWRAQQLSTECQASISAHEQAESSIALEVTPASVNTGDTVTVTGTITHASDMPIPINITWPAVQVTLQYTEAGGSPVTKQVTLGTDGKFTDTFKPESDGDWSVTATWQGDDDHKAATSNTATFKSSMNILIIVGGAVVVLVVVGAGVYFFVLKKKPTAVPTPPPPQLGPPA